MAEFRGKEKNADVHVVMSFLIDLTATKKRETIEGFPYPFITQIVYGDQSIRKHIDKLAQLRMHMGHMYISIMFIMVSARLVTMCSPFRIFAYYSAVCSVCQRGESDLVILYKYVFKINAQQSQKNGQKPGNGREPHRNRVYTMTTTPNAMRYQPNILKSWRRT